MAIANIVRQERHAENFRLIAKKRLLELGKSVTGLADELGLARNTVSIAINHPTMLPGVKRRITKELRLS